MRNKPKNKKSIFVKVAAFILLAVFALASVGVLYIFFNYETEIDVSMFGTKLADSTTRFYYLSSSGEEIELDETLKGSRKILHCDIENMPQNLINAFVAIEDKRFFDHGGVDFYRTAGAAANYILGFDDRFGASTITQQLIKNVSGKNDISVKRKIQEIPGLSFPALYAIMLS
jgi:penicillin-binding protein 1A